MVRINKEVTIKVKTNQAHIARVGENLEVNEVVYNRNRIGSALKGNDVLRGLTTEEERKYLPSIVGVSPDSPNWDKAIRDYWVNITHTVPYPEGSKLEVGMTFATKEDANTATNEEEAEFQKYVAARAEGKFYRENFEKRFKLGKPINLEDYILWRYCLVYSHVANTPDEVHHSAKIRFYLESKTRKIAESKRALQARKKAYSEYLEVLDDRSQVDNLMVILRDTVAKVNKPSEDNYVNVDTDENKDLVLERVVRNYPNRFLTSVNDKQLARKAFIERCIDHNFLRRVPNTDTIIYGDNTVIGNNINEAIDFLATEENKEIYQNLKARLNATR